MLMHHGIVRLGAVDLVPLHEPLVQLGGELGDARLALLRLGHQRGDGARGVDFAVDCALYAGEAGKGLQGLVPDGLTLVGVDARQRHVDVEFLDDGGAAETQRQAELGDVDVPEEEPALLGFVGWQGALVVAVVAEL